MAASTSAPPANQLSSSSTPAVALTNFKFTSIGQPARLAQRFTDPNPNDRLSSPVNDPSGDDQDPHQATYIPPTSRRPTLLQSLTMSTSGATANASPLLAKITSISAPAPLSSPDAPMSATAHVGSPGIAVHSTDAKNQEPRTSPSDSSGTLHTKKLHNLTSDLSAEEVNEDVKPAMPISNLLLPATSTQSNDTPSTAPPNDPVSPPSNPEASCSLLSSPLFASLDRRTAGFSKVHDTLNRRTTEWSKLLGESISSAEDLDKQMDAIKTQADDARKQGERLLEEAARARVLANQLATSAAAVQVDSTAAQSKISRAREHTVKMKKWLAKVNSWNSDMQTKEKSDMDALRADISQLQEDVKATEDRALKAEKELKVTQDATRDALAEVAKAKAAYQELQKELAEQRSMLDKERLEKRDIEKKLISAQKDIYNLQRSNDLLNEGTREHNQASTSYTALVLPPKGAKSAPSSAAATAGSVASRSISPLTRRSTSISGRAPSIVSALPDQPRRESQTHALSNGTTQSMSSSSHDTPALVSIPLTSRTDAHVPTPKGFVPAQTAMGRAVNTDMPFAETVLASERNAGGPRPQSVNASKTKASQRPPVKDEPLSPVVPSLPSKHPAPAPPVPTVSPSAALRDSTSASKDHPPPRAHREGAPLQRNRYSGEHPKGAPNPPTERDRAPASPRSHGPPSSSTSSLAQKGAIHRPQPPKAKQHSSPTGPSRATRASRVAPFSRPPPDLRQESSSAMAAPLSLHDPCWDVAPSEHYGDGGWQSTTGDRATPVLPRIDDFPQSWPSHTAYRDDPYPPLPVHGSPAFYHPPSPTQHRGSEYERQWGGDHYSPARPSVLGKRPFHEEFDEYDRNERWGSSPQYRPPYHRSPSPVPLRHRGDSWRPSPSPPPGPRSRRSSFITASPIEAYHTQPSGSYHDRPLPPPPPPDHVEHLQPSSKGDNARPSLREGPRNRKRQAIEDKAQPYAGHSISNSNASLLERMNSSRLQPPAGKRGPRLKMRPEPRVSTDGESRAARSPGKPSLAGRMSSGKTLEERID